MMYSIDPMDTVLPRCTISVSNSQMIMCTWLRMRPPKTYTHCGDGLIAHLYGLAIAQSQCIRAVPSIANSF